MYYFGVIEPMTTGSGGCASGGPQGLPDLVQLSNLVFRIAARVAAGQGVTPVQARMLCILETGPRRMAELAQSLAVEKAALTGLVDRAEGRGLVSRSAVPGDRRAMLVSLTDSGAQSAVAFHHDLDDALDRMLEPLADDERAAFRRMTATMLAAASVYPGLSTGGDREQHGAAGSG